MAPIDLSLISSIRRSMPLELHRRYDVYPKAIQNSLSNKFIEDHHKVDFGNSVVKGLQVFYKTKLCFAFTNIKCVLPGRILL